MKRELENYIRKLIGTDIALDYPPAGGGEKFGDYASSAAFKLAKSANKPPMAVAEDLAKEIREKDSEKMFERVMAVAPGFVNFWVRGEIFLEYLSKIEIPHLNPALNALSGGINPPPSAEEGGEKRKKINLEFVSANPTGPLTMANGRGGFLGDVLARVLEIAGYDVTREYYINDAGVQIKKLGESILAALGMAPQSEEHYQGEYIKELAGKLKEKITKKQKNKKTLKSEEVGRLAAKELLASIKKSIKNVGLKYDKWFSEYKDLRKKGELEKTLALLRERGMVYEREGATWLKTQESTKTRKQEKQKTGEIKKEEIATLKTPRNDKEIQEGEEKSGDDKDRVLIKSDGEATYFLADLAYHYNKFFERKFDQAIVIWGADHHGYVPRMKSGIEAMGINPDKFGAIIVQLIRLVRGGREVKMSKRRGDFVTLDDLIKEVGRDAARFFFLMHSPETHMDFDLDLAKEKSVKNPVYYAQYAYVRCLSILTKARKHESAKAQEQKNKKTNIQIDKLKILNSDSEKKLIKELTKLQDMILDTAEDFQVNRLIRYAMELSRNLHNFYEKERVIGEDGAVVESRLALVSAAKDVFEKLFDILGITKLKKM